jgi:alkanesulfonate monooxygenase SsuD/methylene tetrahydromethanopterin reductase-like flavin-dependent oxidoreductase (luciferase family)
MTFSLLREGRLVPIPPVETAVQFLAGRARPGGSEGARRRGLVGSPATVRDGLEELARRYGADEVIVLTITHEHAARRRSYELVADAFALSARS